MFNSNGFDFSGKPTFGGGPALGDGFANGFGPKPCKRCGGSMLGRRCDAIYCSRACKEEARREADRPKDARSPMRPHFARRVTDLRRAAQALAKLVSDDRFGRHQGKITKDHSRELEGVQRDVDAVLAALGR